VRCFSALSYGLTPPTPPPTTSSSAHSSNPQNTFSDILTLSYLFTTQLLMRVTMTISGVVRRRASPVKAVLVAKEILLKWSFFRAKKDLIVKISPSSHKGSSLPGTTSLKAKLLRVKLRRRLKRTETRLFVPLPVYTLCLSVVSILCVDEARCFIKIWGRAKNRGSTNKCTKFGQLIVRKIIRIIAIRCHI